MALRLRQSMYGINAFYTADAGRLCGHVLSVFDQESSVRAAGHPVESHLHCQSHSKDQVDPLYYYYICLFI